MLPVELILGTTKSGVSGVSREIITHLASSDYSSLHTMRKCNGYWHPSDDYHKLKAITIPEQYYVPHIQTCAQSLSEEKE